MAIVASPSPSVVTDLVDDASSDWQQSLRRAVRDPDELCRRLELPAEYTAAARRAAALFGVFVPQEYLNRMRRADPYDPLLRQVLPLGEEFRAANEYTDDPVGDGEALAAPGLLHKYDSRVLLVTTGACAVHCRYCFRRHFPYAAMPKRADDWQPALDRIAADATIEEVILSGGDPLTLLDARLAELVHRLEGIEHLRRLRIHTRLPIMIPSRMTRPLLDCLGGTRLTTLMVIHANHAAEIDDEVASALSTLVAAGMPTLNQSVLLRGVNDDADALVELSKRLVDIGVMPYYLHQLDRVRGAAHFEVPVDRGIAIVEQMRTRLPGYAVPRFVQEIPGAAHKQTLA